MHELLEGLLLPSFSSQQLLARHGGAVLNIAVARPAFTTDSDVVKPLFVPGGDIGRLAVNGTLNDFAVCTARPLIAFVPGRGTARALQILPKQSISGGANRSGS